MKYLVYEDGCWMHKHPLKLIVNPILRKLQFFTNKPYVIASKFDKQRTKFIGFTFCRVRYYKNIEEFIKKS